MFLYWKENTKILLVVFGTFYYKGPLINHVDHIDTRVFSYFFHSYLWSVFWVLNSSKSFISQNSFLRLFWRFLMITFLRTTKYACFFPVYKIPLLQNRFRFFVSESFAMAYFNHPLPLYSWLRSTIIMELYTIIKQHIIEFKISTNFWADSGYSLMISFSIFNFQIFNFQISPPKVY